MQESVKCLLQEKTKREMKKGSKVSNGFALNILSMLSNVSCHPVTTGNRHNIKIISLI